MPFEAAGLDVIFTNDLSPYRTRKVRILNGAHTAMVPVGYLDGATEVKETLNDAQLGSFVRDVIYKEIIPTLTLPQDELEKFAAAVIDRFKNPFIKHLLIDISLNSISKFKVRVLPSLLRHMELKSVAPELITKAFAHLIYFYSGKNKNGEAIAIRDDQEKIDFFRNAWENKSRPKDARSKSIIKRRLLGTKLIN